MKTTPQFDLHPDAESLNAFVEQALPERERGQVTAHLAECGRCRQVVYLAQELAEGVETATTASLAGQPVAAQPAGKRSRTWFGGWRLAWIPATALAAVAGVVVVVQMRHVVPAPGSGQEVAKVAPPPELRTKRDGDAGKSPEAPTVSSPAKMPVEKKALSITGRNVSNSQLDEAVPAAPPPVATDAAVAAHDEPNGASGQPGAIAQGFITQAPTVHGPSTQSQQVWHGSQQAVPYPPAPSAPATGTMNSTGADAVQAKANGTADAKSAEAVANAVTVVEQSSAALPVIHQELRPNPPGASAEDFQGARKQAARAALATKAVRLKLPSGLATASLAMGMHRTLAIDSGGAVFLSEDGGMNWKPVTRPWTGQPVLVRFRELPQANNAGLAKQAIGGPVNKTNAPNGMSTGAIAGSLTLTGTFEIVTDSGQVWMSADGDDWKTK